MLQPPRELVEDFEGRQEPKFDMDGFPLPQKVQQSTTVYNAVEHECNNSTTAVQRDNNSVTTWSNKGVSGLINGYMRDFSGTFYLRDLDEYVRSGLGLDKLPRQYQFYRSKILSDMVQEGRLERTAKGGYRIIDEILEDLDFMAAEAEPHPLKLPMGLNDLVTINPKEIVLICGNPDAGKTAFAFSVALANLYSSCCTTLKDKYIYHFVSETGPAAFRQKLLSISPEMPHEYQCRARTLVYKADSIQDQVHPDAVNIIDYLEPKNNDYREIVPTIDAIFRKLSQGVAVLCLQQHPGQAPRGGLGVFEKPRLILSLANDKERQCKTATIVKGKNNKTNLGDLIGLEMDYIVKRRGTLIKPLMDEWKWRQPSQKPIYNTNW